MQAPSDRNSKIVLRGCLWSMLAFALLFLTCTVCVIASVDDVGDTSTSSVQPGAGSLSTAVTSIQGYPEVIDAAAESRGGTISLVLVVGAATNEQRARQLGDNFVRMAKSFSDDDPPGSRSIGTGKYDYLISVYTSTDQVLARGAKSRSSDRISW